MFPSVFPLSAILLTTMLKQKLAPCLWVTAVVCLLVPLGPLKGQSPNPGRKGVLISEIHHESRGDGLPTYIELQNIDPNSVAVNLSNAVISVQGAGGASTTFSLPAGTTLPPYQRTMNMGGFANPGAGTLTLVDPNGPTFTANEQVIAASSLFPQNSNALNPAGQQPWTVCLSVPNPNGGLPLYSDTVQLNGGAGPCLSISAPFNGLLPYDGLVVRGYRVDSNTRWDFIPVQLPGMVPPAQPPYQGPPVGPSPTLSNPEMSPVTGFFFGDPLNRPQDAGLPFTTQLPPFIPPGGSTGAVSNFTSIPSGFSGQITIQATPPGQLAWVHFAGHPYAAFREQRDPAFDPVIPNGSLNIDMTVIGDGHLLGHAPPGPGVGPVSSNQTWNLTIPGVTGPPGNLNIDMGPMDQASVGFLTYQSAPPQSANERRLRVGRVLTDNQSDGPASGSGDLSPAMLDTLPPEGEIWCDIIVYTGNGFTYRGKARNWPANPNACTGLSPPNLGLGSNAAGNIDVIATCFDPLSEIYILPTLNLAASLGTGPLFGLNPDPLTWYALGQASGTDPWHSETTIDGLYLWSTTNPTLSGLTIDAVAIQWGSTGPTGVGFTQASPANRVTIL